MLECWNVGIVECCGVSRNPASAGEEWNSGRIRPPIAIGATMEEWNVEALAEIPLRREKNGMMEGWKGGNKGYAFFVYVFFDLRDC